MKWLQSGRRRDLCVLLYGDDGVPAQKLKTALERRYDERIDPKQFYGALEALERLGHVRSRTEGLSDVYRDSRQSASGLDPEGECRKLH
ncbi:Transcriptional regulator, PadR family [Halapricum desulfuricans]|uniref:Transcriptional regulator, PadR family n=1 Tax=Halapricum desulfuricans TaxID=2841257 RepID=A0A897NL36_9EURY|nr:PadR family transcriptional regulator [Halapricum desulfuricans]QSG13144.1 Transcriptional regulator, PadR family [Halapricum desulfuricans]